MGFPRHNGYEMGRFSMGLGGDAMTHSPTTQVATSALLLLMRLILFYFNFFFSGHVVSSFSPHSMELVRYLTPRDTCVLVRAQPALQGGLARILDLRTNTGSSHSTKSRTHPIYSVPKHSALSGRSESLSRGPRRKRSCAANITLRYHSTVLSGFGVRSAGTYFI
ncbi:hypothetical protein F4802DRAFT_395112 [Xylaria palmicola]|nr:hypothetical protein F4802DRAFT_395112 [Xylaria palmicola]